MLKDIVEVRAADGYRLNLRFEDGVEGTVDIASLVEFTGVFAPLRDRSYFLKAHGQRGPWDNLLAQWRRPGPGRALCLSQR